VKKLNPKQYYPTLNLKWGREEYNHNIGFNIMYPDYIKTELFYKNTKLENPTFLYKYFKANDDNLNTLNDGYLYFSNPKNFGDEYDCLVSDDEYINQIIDDSKNIRNKIGVCCFCTIPNEDLMWDHYADGFKGFVLKFKNNSKFLPYGKDITIKSHIMYLKDNGPNNSNLIETIKSMNGKHFPKVVKSWQKTVLFHHEFCRKRFKYNYEKEFRAISFFAEEYGRKIYIDKKNIDSIYIGNKMTEEYLNKLKPILKSNNHIKVFIVKHNYEKQKIKFNRLKNLNNLT
jgi:hypothetical protein